MSLASEGCCASSLGGSPQATLEDVLGDVKARRSNDNNQTTKGFRPRRPKIGSRPSVS